MCAVGDEYLVLEQLDLVVIVALAALLGKAEIKQEGDRLPQKLVYFEEQIGAQCLQLAKGPSYTCRSQRK